MRQSVEAAWREIADKGFPKTMEAGRTVNAFRLHRFSVPCQGTRSTAQTSILRKRRRDSLDCGERRLTSMPSSLSYSWILSYSGVFRRCGSRLYRLTLLYMVLRGICRNDAVFLMSPPYCSSASAISFFSKPLF